MSDDHELVYVRTPHRLHRAVRIDGVLMTNECDNLDQATDREVLLTFPEAIDAGTLCRRCFPQQSDTFGPDATVTFDPPQGSVTS